MISSDLNKIVSEAKAKILEIAGGDLRIASFIVYSCANEFESEKAIHIAVKDIELRKHQQ